MLQQCHSVNRLLQEWGCSCRDRCQPGLSRQLLSTATWTLQSRPDMRSFSYLTIRARDGAPLFRIGEIFGCHSGGCSQSLVRDTVNTPVRMQCCSRRDSLIRCAGVGEPVQRKQAIKRCRASISSPCSGRRRPPLPPDYSRSDARSGRARTNPTNYACRASSHTGRGAAPFREEALLALPRLRLISIRDREAAF